MARRGIGKEIVQKILENPEQRVPMKKGRIVFQSRIPMKNPEKTYLVRVFVDIDRDPPEVITVYRTSRISKYFQEGR